MPDPTANAGAATAGRFTTVVEDREMMVHLVTAPELDNLKSNGSHATMFYTLASTFFAWALSALTSRLLEPPTEPHARAASVVIMVIGFFLAAVFLAFAIGSSCKFRAITKKVAARAAD